MNTIQYADVVSYEQDKDYLQKLVEKIVWKLKNASEEKILDLLYDIQTFGNEPVLTGLIFSRMLEEQNE